MIIAKITQDNLELTISEINIPYQYSQGLEIEFIKDANYKDYTLLAFYKLEGDIEAKLMECNNDTISIAKDVFKKIGKVSFSFSLTSGEEVIHLGVVEFYVRRAFGNDETILPQNDRNTWMDLIENVAKDKVDNYWNVFYKKQIDSIVKDISSKVSDVSTYVNQANLAKTEAQRSATSASNSASNALESSNKAKEHLDSINTAVNSFNTNVENANKTLEAKIEDVNFEIDKKIDKNLGEENSNKLLGTDEEGNIIVKDDIQLTAENISYKNTNVSEALDDAFEKIGDLMYIQISITSFANNKNTVEMGVIVDTVVLNWNYNKVPKTLMLDNEILDVNLKTKTLSGQNISSNKTYTLRATDERNAVSTKTTSITFLNGVYYGVGDDLVIDSITNQFILSLTKTLQSSKAKTFTVNAGESKHIYYAIPSRYGTPAFKVGGFEGGFGKIGTFNFTNASNYIENYDIYKSSNSNLGNTTVVVS